MKITEEEKSEALYQLEDEYGHDELKNKSTDEIERLILKKLKEMKGIRDDEKDDKKKKKKKKAAIEKMYI
ncbi:MAG: hypothetical protein ACTSU9_12610 [Promethearchaeota archaeon]